MGYRYTVLGAGRQCVVTTSMTHQRLLASHYFDAVRVRSGNL